MARKRDRVIAGVFAAVFIFSVLSVGALTIYTMATDDNNSDQQANTQEEKVDPAKQLQGKPLANFTPVTAPIDKVQVIDLKEGSGDEVKKGATITFHYTGALAATGIVFQSSHDTGQPITYPLDQLIKGWQEGIPGMKEGGQRRLLIPYALGYGDAGTPDGSIPPKADLVFDIEVTEIKK